MFKCFFFLVLKISFRCRIVSCNEYVQHTNLPIMSLPNRPSDYSCLITLAANLHFKKRLVFNKYIYIAVQILNKEK